MVIEGNEVTPDEAPYVREGVHHEVLVGDDPAGT